MGSRRDFILEVVRTGGVSMAEAIGQDGKVLRKSEIVTRKKYIYQYVPGQVEMTWLLVWLLKRY